MVKTTGENENFLFNLINACGDIAKIKAAE